MSAGADARPPGYWRHEITGVLRPVVEAYLRGEPLSARQIHVMRLYLEQWIESPVWDSNPHATDSSRAELAELRRQAHAIRTREDIDTWLRLAVDIGIDPL